MEIVPNDILHKFSPFLRVFAAKTEVDVNPIATLVGASPTADVALVTGSGLAALAGWRLPLASSEPIRVESLGIGELFGPTLALPPLPLPGKKVLTKESAE